MGQHMTARELQTRFAEPLQELAANCKQLCERWEKAQKNGDIARPDLLLNDVTPTAAMGTLRKFVREASGKLDDAIAGVYRYRNVATPKPKAKRKKRRR